ncbi:MAG: S-layer homology domain-containing protein, partial [Clostridiales bacterium]|nr:S-layer homology domain-containing protein [Clostridiales bacterium]
MKKRILSMMLAASMLAGPALTTSASAAEGSDAGNEVKKPQLPADVLSEWYYEDVKTIFDLGIMLGKAPDELWHPNDESTRAEIAMIMCRFAGAEEEAKGLGANVKFGDVAKDHWAADAIAWANKHGLILGFDGNFRPDDNVRRDELAAMLVRLLKYMNKDLDNEPLVDEFVDKDTFGWAADEIEEARKEGLVEGKEGGKDNAVFKPAESSNRAQVATIVSRMIDPMHKALSNIGSRVLTKDSKPYVEFDDASSITVDGLNKRLLSQMDLDPKVYTFVIPDEQLSDAEGGVKNNASFGGLEDGGECSYTFALSIKNLNSGEVTPDHDVEILLAKKVTDSVVEAFKNVNDACKIKLPNTLTEDEFKSLVFGSVELPDGGQYTMTVDSDSFKAFTDAAAALEDGSESEEPVKVTVTLTNTATGATETKEVEVTIVKDSTVENPEIIYGDAAADQAMAEFQDRVLTRDTRPYFEFGATDSVTAERFNQILLPQLGLDPEVYEVVVVNLDAIIAFHPNINDNMEAWEPMEFAIKNKVTGYQTETKSFSECTVRKEYERPNSGFIAMENAAGSTVFVPEFEYLETKDDVIVAILEAAGVPNRNLDGVKRAYDFDLSDEDYEAIKKQYAEQSTTPVELTIQLKNIARGDEMEEPVVIGVKTFFDATADAAIANFQNLVLT